MNYFFISLNFLFKENVHAKQFFFFVNTSNWKTGKKKLFFEINLFVEPTTWLTKLISFKK